MGKKYDYTMVARFVTREQEDRDSNGKWFCSELVCATSRKGGIDLLARTGAWEGSPTARWVTERIVSSETGPQSAEKTSLRFRVFSAHARRIVEC